MYYLEREVNPRLKMQRNRISNEAWAEKISETPAYKFETPFRKSFLALALIGGLPITWKKPTILTYAGVVYTQYAAYSNYIYRWQTEDLPVHLKVIIVEVFLVLLFPLATLTLWSDVGTLQRMIATYTRLSELYFQLTKKNMIMGLKKLESLVIGVAFILPTFGYEVGERFTPGMKPKQIYMLSFVHAAPVWALISEMWTMLFFFVSVTAEEINSHLLKTVKEHSLSSEKLRQYQTIWVEMRNLMDEVGSLNTPVLFVSIFVVAEILFLYAGLMLCQMGNYFASFPHFALASSIAIVAVMMSYQGNAAVTNMKAFFTGALALKEMRSVTGALPRQVFQWYLLNKLRPPCCELDGFFNINKIFLAQLLTVVVVHLVMLGQVLDAQ